MLKKGVCVAGLVCMITSGSIFGQDSQPARLPGHADPFELSRGSSFSASGRRHSLNPRSAPHANISSDLEEAIALIAENHVAGRTLQTEQLTDAAIVSMLHTLDPHSNYYNAEEFQSLLGEHASEYTGTGSSIAGFERNGRVETYVVSTFAGSPADLAGLRFGDRIVAVDGRSVSGVSPASIRDMVRGRRGTSVRVTIERAEDQRIETVEMKRDRVHEPAVPEGFLLGDGVGYIDLTNGFSNATFEEFNTAFNDLKKRSMLSLILDLRGNGGGILDQAIKVAEKFLPRGSTIVSQKGRYSGDTRTWRATQLRYESLPLVVLVDENTASASEVLAGALQDNDRAMIVGRKTFGKGLVQSVLNLPKGAGLTLTAARYYTPTGRSIQRDYAATGLYDYYHHRSAEIDKPLYAARTVTNRVVYGGDGITPDANATEVPLDASRARLLDPIFYFSLELLTGKIKGPTDSRGLTPLQYLRQKMIYGKPLNGGEFLASFEAFADRNPDWAGHREALRKERAFVTRMLAYYLSIAASGPDSANQARIEGDPQVRLAVNTLPASAQLAAAARAQAKKKAR